ncbi:MAG: tyrosine-protein kinase family protein [Pirellula sp.]
MSNEVNQAFLRAYVKNRAERALQGTKPVNPAPPSVVRRDIPNQGDSIRIDQTVQPNTNSSALQADGQTRSIPAPHLAGFSKSTSHASKDRAPQLHRASQESPRQDLEGGVWSPIGVERGMKGTNRSNSAPAIVVNAPRNESVPNIARMGSRTLASQAPTTATQSSSTQPSTERTGSTATHTSAPGHAASDQTVSRIRVDSAHGQTRQPHSSEIMVSQSSSNSLQVSPSIVVNDNLPNLRDRFSGNAVMANPPIMAGAGIASTPSGLPLVAAKKANSRVTESLPTQPTGTTDRIPSHSDSVRKPMPQHGEIHSESKLSGPKLSSSFSEKSKTNRPVDRGPSDRDTSATSLPMHVAFTPSWEVDRFAWPDVLKQIENSDAAAFAAISKHLRLANQDGLKVIAVTSGERGVGRSTVSMHLARCTAASGLKVALIDADGFHPSLIDQLKLDLDHGWQECLFENIPLEEVAIKSIEDNITLFPLTSVIPTQQLHVNLHRMAKIVKRVSMAFDMVILDSNRLNLEQRDLVGVSQDRVVDAAIVVTDSELSVKEKVDTAVSILHGMGIASVGLVQNFHS